ncbi:DNA-binding NarL/FixJ family response regulator [Desulfobaculum xiamenense]|uniref:DNA-binding NarL/FixJ family response regulator n=1 Tax=Desulfobaculum xiamenense TaxID=995050 RepID=A0A846QRB0_9BACT|nr:DNA-binding NarL/FixJ family response regulator [Desulfobaculum xiamenense]
MKECTRIFIAEDHTLLRDGLKVLISANPDWIVVGEASDGIETLEQIRTLDVDLLLIDLTMPRMSGVRVIEELRKTLPKLRILVLTAHSDEEFVYSALRAGADGYVVKDSTNEDLATAINSVMNGKSYLSPTVSMDVIHGYLDGRNTAAPTNKLDSLTHRERDVLQLVVDGHSNAEISNLLFISIKTVEKHKTNIMRKLDAANQHDLRRLARETPFVF